MSTHIKDILSQFLKEKQTEQIQQADLQAVVKKVLGDDFREKEQNLTINKGVLTLRCSDPATRYIVGLKKEMIVKAVSERFPQIKKISITL